MKIFTSRTVLGLLLAAISRVAWAQSVPVLVNYQGMLTDATNEPLTTADYTLTFSIYDAARGGDRRSSMAAAAPDTVPGFRS